EVEELTTANAQRFQTSVLAALLSQVKQIHIDLSATARVDCGGVGALIALRKSTRQGQAGTAIRLHNPRPLARRIFQLTRVDQLFSIDGVASPAPTTSPAALAAEAIKPVSV
ncbi:MAG TPA: STAS domain-containing protein, partial [Bacillota bacterium]|nr:STAS domain-containing protein [Bacillota bacterium]